MRSARILSCVSLLMVTAAACAQMPTIDPQVWNKTAADQKIATIELSAHFVTTIRVPEPVNAVVVGDPALFQAEHSEHEPELVFIKVLTAEEAESNLLISTTTGRQISFLLISHARSANRTPVDFLLRYHPAGGFLIEPQAIPFAAVPQTASLPNAAVPPSEGRGTRLSPGSIPSAASDQPKADALDELMSRQRRAPLPISSPRANGHAASGSLQAGISDVLDDGQQVIVTFSVTNRSDHAILLMPPQVQLGGKEKSGKLTNHGHWSTAEQLSVADFRLSRRRIGPGERADGAVLFERPPYKQSNETLFLQLADSASVDRPVLVPIGFGVSTSQEAVNHAQ